MAKLYRAASINAVDQAEYGRMAAVEDEMWFYRALHAHVERELVVGLGSDGAAILDAGCGTGGLIRRLSERHSGWRWTGVDLEPVACELARIRCGAAIVQASVAQLPFADAFFDAVVLSDVLYHLDDDDCALREVHRVLRPGGVVVINVPAHKWLWSYHDVTVHGRRRYVRSEVQRKLRDAGFRVDRLTHWNSLTLPLVIARRKLLPAPSSGSDVRLYPAPVERGLSWLMALERWWIRSVGSLGFGSSILARGAKPSITTSTSAQVPPAAATIPSSR